ncbi:MAG TPA: sulfotransferase domain-containing protein [Phycisphaeraceae bacterium]
MIIWLASYPRSGNTLFRTVLRHRYGVNTCSVYGDAQLEREGVGEVVGNQSMEASLEQMAAAEEVYLVKTHEPPHDTNPAIYLVRDGRDALVSHAWYTRHFGSRRWIGRLLGRCGWESILEDLITSPRQFGGWSRHVKQWCDRSALTVIVRYEDLVADPIGQVDRALAAVGCHWSPKCLEPLPAFDEFRRKSPRFFRKGKAGAWRQEMPRRLEAMFWRLHGQVMEELGYARGLAA